MIYKGINIPFGDLYAGGDYTDEDYNRFKKWNMNSVIYVMAWGRDIELNELQPMIYDQTKLASLKEEKNRAKTHGLKPFISIRIFNHGTGSFGWADVPRLGADYVNLNQLDDVGIRGRDRYCAMLNMLSQMFPDVGICPWHYPYHGQASPELFSDGYRQSVYYNTTFPAMLSAIRLYNKQNVIFVPIFQSFGPPELQWNERKQAGFYEKTAPNYGTNILYGLNTHDSYNSVASGAQPWDEDIEKLEWNFNPVFIQSLPYCAIEMGALNIHRDEGATRPIDPSRLSWLEENMKILRKLNSSWFYWRYEKTPYVESPIEPDGSNTAVADIISEYASTPKFPWGNLLRVLGPIGLGLYFIERTPRRG